MKRSASMVAFALIASPFAWAGSTADFEAGKAFGAGHQVQVKQQSEAQLQQAVPGFQGSNNLPQSNYFASQNPNAMSQEAYQALTNGTAGSAAAFAWQQAQQPKIQLSPNDPLLQNARNIQQNASVDPVTGLANYYSDCKATTVSAPGNTTDVQCVSYLLPQKQSCDKAITVTLNHYLSCSPGQVIATGTLSGTSIGDMDVSVRCWSATHYTLDVNVTRHVSYFNGMCIGGAGSWTLPFGTGMPWATFYADGGVRQDVMVTDTSDATTGRLVVRWVRGMEWVLDATFTGGDHRLAWYHDPMSDGSFVAGTKVTVCSPFGSFSTMPSSCSYTPSPGAPTGTYVGVVDGVNAAVSTEITFARPKNIAQPVIGLDNQCTALEARAQ